ncbi:unnamed protein product [Rotaria sp. Silwood1]|nr:unnamed protein product [Rotaria sp. Silwood1]CAF0735365.1 unnamed protein product [Rotaria sp. Silwood1]CAF3352014.1 unnamed protein product [Rotaria sp. Silwood1]CAF3357833.1 unnamed protein product [Rotaria sp. Silwood1]CAF4718091.1 unnamed protein product [Rotaria sp. Silwood1]
MEWFTVLALILLLILIVVLIVILACMFSGQRCTISIQKRTPNQELTRVQLEEEQKRQKKLSSKFKRSFYSSSKSQQPLAPVENVKTVELTLKLGDDQKNSQQITTNNESSVILLPKIHNNQAERDERQKKREELRKKYNL